VLTIPPALWSATRKSFGVNTAAFALLEELGSALLSWRRRSPVH